MAVSSHTIIVIVFAVICLSSTQQQETPTYTFALVSKVLSNPWFNLAEAGCKERAIERGVECIYTGPTELDANEQADVVRGLIAMGVDGIAMSVIEEDVAAEVIAESIAAGIPFVTFDSDAPNSERLAYIGTDNFAFGQELGKLLVQLFPLGGVYGMISTHAPNVNLVC